MYFYVELKIWLKLRSLEQLVKRINILLLNNIYGKLKDVLLPSITFSHIVIVGTHLFPKK